MEQVSSEVTDSHSGLLQLLTIQNEMIVRILEKQNSMTEKQNETIEKMRNEQNTRLEGLTTAVNTLAKDSNLNSEIVSLMKQQNESVKEMTTAMKTLERNSNLDHDDKPFPTRESGVHEPGWRAAFETLTTKMKDQVERWKNGMDSTLIFVALFVTVITAFQTPVSQNLTPNPVDLTNNILGNLTTMVYGIAMLNGLKVPGGLPQPEPFRPDRTDQVVTLFWYVALLLSLITAIISVLGRQWVEHLTKKPDGQSYKDRSWQLDVREKLAEKLLRPLLDSLHPILIVSIILFIVGLLFQLWFTSFSTGKPPILLLTSSLGSALILGTAAVTVYTLVHGVRREESPFTTSTSLGIRRLLPSRFIKAVSTGGDLYHLFCSAVKQMGETHHFDQVSTVSLGELLASEDVDKIELAVDTIIFVLGSDASLKAKQTVAWNLSNADWWIDKEEVRKKCVDCHWRLYDALSSACLDTPSSQEKVRLTFSVARILVLLKFSGDKNYLENLENGEIKKTLLKILNFDPKNCIDKGLLHDAKLRAHLTYLDLARTDPNLFDDVIDDEHLLHEIFRRDVDETWKSFILKRLNEETITKILDNISTKSFGENADCLHLLKILFLVLSFCKLPFVFPRNFNISNLTKFATTDGHRFDQLPWSSSLLFSSSASAVNTLLSCLSLMDGSLLCAQQHLLEFFVSLDRQDHQISSIRDEIPLTPASIIEIRDRVPLPGEHTTIHASDCVYLSTVDASVSIL